MTIITNSPLTNYNNAAIQKNVASFKAATIPDIQNDTIEIQGKKRGLSKGAKIGDVYLSHKYIVFHDRRVDIPGWNRMGQGYFPCIDSDEIARLGGF